MRKGKLAAFIVAVATVVGIAPGARASVVISIVDFSFSPASKVVPMGTQVEWENQGSATHSSTQNSPFSFWDSGFLSPGSNFTQTLNFGGTYPYHCSVHSSMTGKIIVQSVITPTSGTTSTTFTMTMGAVVPPSGLVFDVQTLNGDGMWVSFRRGVTSKTITFTLSAPGTYSFRSRVRRTSNGSTSGFSPKRTITVS